MVGARGLRLGRAALAALVGGVAGAVVLGMLVGVALELLDLADEGLQALVDVLRAGALGAFLGGAAVLWFVFRHEVARARLVTTLTRRTRRTAAPPRRPAGS